MNQKSVAAYELAISWYFGVIGAITLHTIPIILSSVASLMAIINYYYQIKKNRQK